MTSVDVVVVAYNNGEELRKCVSPLAAVDDVMVFVVDNASSRDSLSFVRDLPVVSMPLETNGGFAHGCNAGWRAGRGRHVLFLNPDARIESDSLETLAHILEADETIGAVAPRITHDDGTLDFSQRRYPRLISTYAQALFLHRLFPERRWVDELIRDPGAYGRSGSPDWVSGAAVMVRREVLEAIDGFDDGFFMYCEDIDLCRRIRAAGYDIRYVADASVVHEGGVSAPRAELLPILATSRIRYATKHRSALYAWLERLGVALGALTHVAVSRGGRGVRQGHLKSLRVAISRRAS